MIRESALVPAVVLLLASLPCLHASSVLAQELTPPISSPRPVAEEAAHALDAPRATAMRITGPISLDGAC